MQIKNAIIRSVKIEIEHALSIWITLDYGGTCQSFGGHVYTSWEWEDRSSPNYAGHFIKRVLDITEVTNWDLLRGKAVRAKLNDSGLVCAIGNIVKDKWFNPQEELDAVRNG